MAGTVRAIEEYLAVENSDRPTRKVVGEEAESSQLAAQSEVEALEQSAKGPSAVRSYSEVVRQPGPGRTVTQVVRQTGQMVVSAHT